MTAHFDSAYFYAQLLHPPSLLLYGLGMTLLLAVSAQCFGFCIGLLLAVARMSRNRPVALCAAAYIWTIRGVPLLVQLVFLYTGLAAAGILRFSDLSFGGLVIAGNLQAAILALSLHEGAYMAEILRAGMLAVPREEVEAIIALGASRWLALRRIIVPRGLGIALPAIGNQFNSVLKNTTLVSIIGVSDALLATQTIDSTDFRTFELYAVLAIYFLLLTGLWNITLAWLEARLRRPQASQHSSKTQRFYQKRPHQKHLRTGFLFKP